MKQIAEGLAWVFGLLLLLVMVTGLLQLFGFASFSFYAPKVVAVQTKAFKQSQAYNDGMANDLGDLRLQYLGAKSPEQREAVRAIVLQRFAGYDKDRLPAELREFYFSLTTTGDSP